MPVSLFLVYCTFPSNLAPACLSLCEFEWMSMSQCVNHTAVCIRSLHYLSTHSHISWNAVALPTLAGQYPVFSAAPAAAKLMEEGKVHTVEHLINPLAMQHPEHNSASAAAAAAAAATVLPAVSTPPPFQVCIWHFDMFLKTKFFLRFSHGWLGLSVKS